MLKIHRPSIRVSVAMLVSILMISLPSNGSHNEYPLAHYSSSPTSEFESKTSAYSLTHNLFSSVPKKYVIAGCLSAWAVPVLLYAYYQKNMTHVGVVKIENAIYESTTYVRQLERFFKNQTIKAIVLKIESPGGAAGAGSSLYHEIQQLKKQYPKPVIAISENMMASAAYWIATAADWIIVAPATVAGSIGVISMRIDIKELLNNFHIKVDSYTEGNYKNSFNLLTTITPEQEALIKQMNANVYEQFTKGVAISRNLSLEKVTEWADGKLFTGHQALKLGLVDEIGSWSDLTAKIKELTKSTGTIKWVYPPKVTPLMRFVGADNEYSSSSNAACYSQFADALIHALEKRYSTVLA